MLFEEMRDLLIEHFEEMTKDREFMFCVLVDKDELWNLYLDSFPKGTNEIFIKNREYDCSCCRGFIKGIGNAVVIKNNKVETIWNVNLGDDVFQPVFDKLNQYILDAVTEKGIEDIYLSIFPTMGCHHNIATIEGIGLKQFDHFYLQLPKKFVIRDGYSKAYKLAEHRDIRNVFKRSLDEFTIEAIDSVLDLINQNSLYKGEEWKTQLNTFRKHKIEYDKLSEEEKAFYSWEVGVGIGPVIGKIRNHSIGTLISNLSQGMELEMAVRKYEEITAPSNYKRSKPIYTQKMLDDAQKKITELGYLESLSRRYAKLDDITVNDILFSNKDSAKRIEGALDVFGELALNTKGTKAKNFEHLNSIPYDKFISEVLPEATELELYFENKHAQNMVSLIAPVNKDSKSMFKWGNGFCWTYSGNMTDSMKERVKNFGGKVDGVLRFSIQWNHYSGNDNSDLDAHCKEPNGTEIYFGHCRKPSKSVMTGQLDVDIIQPLSQCKDKVAVENITWSNKDKMRPGIYSFWVNQFAARGSNDGFSAEIEFDGNIYQFEYPHPVHGNVKVADVELNGNGEFIIKPHLTYSQSSKNVWNVSTNKFVPVSVVCFSPNHWETAETQVGHKHVFFMLKDCINDESPSGFFNEFLCQELYEHRKVMEALSGKMRVQDTEDQLSGIGFATDKRAEVVLKVKNNASEQIYKVQF